MLHYYRAGLNPPSAVDVGPAFFMLFVQGFGRIIPSDIGSNKIASDKKSAETPKQIPQAKTLAPTEELYSYK